MAQQNSRYFGEIISIFMMLMLSLALVAGQARSADEPQARSTPVSVTNAGKVAADPLRRPADVDRRFSD